MPWTTTRIPVPAGKVSVVTGARSGIGLETGRALAEASASVTPAVRDVDERTAVPDEIRSSHLGNGFELLERDPASLESIHNATAELRSRSTGSIS